MKRNRVLLIGSSFSAMPLFVYLKNAGYKVAVCGIHKDDPCHIYADKSFFLDYSNRETLLKLCKKEKFDYIVPSCNDYAYNSASYVSDKLKKFYGFDDYDTTIKLHTKNGFREHISKLNLSSPKQYIYSLSKIEYDFPVLLKPNVSFSGIGINKISNFMELKNRIKKLDVKTTTIEEFVDGNLHSHSAFIMDGKIVADFFVDEFCLTYPYQVDLSYMSKILSKNIKNRIRSEIKILIKSLKLSDGLLHTQFISNKNKFWLIETMRRCPGDLYGSLIEKSTGFNYTQAYCEPFLGRKISNLAKNNKTRSILRHTVSTRDSVKYKSLTCNNLSNMEFFPLKQSAYTLEKAPFDKVGILFARYKNEKSLQKNGKMIKNDIKINKY